MDTIIGSTHQQNGRVMASPHHGSPCGYNLHLSRQLTPPPPPMSPFCCVSPNYYSSPNRIRVCQCHECQNKDLSSKLGEAEYKIRELEDAIQEMQLKNKANSNIFEKKNYAIKEEIEIIESKFKQKCEELETVKKKMEETENYLMELLSPDEAKRLQCDLKETIKENKVLKEKLKAIYNKWKANSDSVRNKDLYISCLEQKTKELQLYLNECAKPSPPSTPPLEEIDHYKLENLKSDYNNVIKLLEVSEKKYQQLNIQYKTMVTSFQDKVDQEVQIVNNLHKDLEDKETTISTFKENFNLITNENTELHEKQMYANKEKQHTQESQNELTAILIQIEECICGFENIIKVCSQYSKKEEMDTTLLFSSQTFDSNIESLPLGERVSNLKVQIETFRSILIDRCAKYMSEQIDCSIQ